MAEKALTSISENAISQPNTEPIMFPQHKLKYLSKSNQGYAKKLLSAKSHEEAVGLMEEFSATTFPLEDRIAVIGFYACMGERHVLNGLVWRFCNSVHDSLSTIRRSQKKCLKLQAFFRCCRRSCRTRNGRNALQLVLAYLGCKKASKALGNNFSNFDNFFAGIYVLGCLVTLASRPAHRSLFRIATRYRQVQGRMMAAARLVRNGCKSGADVLRIEWNNVQDSPRYRCDAAFLLTSAGDVQRRADVDEIARHSVDVKVLEMLLIMIDERGMTARHNREFFAEIRPVVQARLQQLKLTPEQERSELGNN